MVNKSSYFVDCSNGRLQMGYHGVVNQLIPGACQGYASRDCPKNQGLGGGFNQTNDQMVVMDHGFVRQSTSER